MMKNKVQSVILFLLLGVVLITCNKKKEGSCVHPDDKAALYIIIVDNNGQKIGKALITLFDTYENYQKATASKNNPIYAQDSIRSVGGGSEVFMYADPYKEHWILATYYDSTQQKFLSSELTTSKINKLQSCSDYHIQINLEAVGGTVAFWTSASLNLPIKIQFNKVIDSLQGFTSVAPTDPITPGAPGELLFPVKAGTYEYQASSKDGCAWTGQVTVKDGQFVTVELQPCARALVAFYFSSASAIPTNKQSIDVYVDNDPTPVGTLTVPAGTPTTSCSGFPNVLYVYLEPGVSHVYKAVSTVGSNGVPCFWSGNTPVLNTSCSANTPIFLGSGCQ
jgi:hypothetical protein